MKNWSHINPDIPARDALKQCFDEDIMTSGHGEHKRFFLGNTWYDINGVAYFGYRNVTWKEVEENNLVVYWFEGLNVLWTNVINQPWTPEGRGREKLRFEWTPEETVLYESYFDKTRIYSGSRHEVNELCRVPRGLPCQ
jgi:hypothetical protein